MKLENKCIIYFSPLNWHDNWQRQQEFASRMAQDNQVLFITPIGFFNYSIFGVVKKVFMQLFGIKKGKQREIQNEVPKNIHFATLVFIPRHNNQFFEAINTPLLVWQLKRKLKAFEMNSEYVFWTGNPVRTLSNLVEKLKPSVVVYDNAMRFEKLPDAPSFVLKHEEIMVKKCSFVICDNSYKQKQYEAWGAKVYKIPQAVNLSQFDVTKSYAVPKSLANISHPIVGYYGVLREVVDFELLEYISDILPDHTFVLIGNIWDSESLKELQMRKNVRILPAVPHSELPSHLAQFDVALIPYKVNEYTQGTFPNKLFEYFSFLKPVVAEPLPEFASYKDFMYLTSDKEQFANYVQEAAKKGCKNKDQLYTLVQNNTWESRYKELEAAFEAYNPQ